MVELNITVNKKWHAETNKTKWIIAFFRNLVKIYQEAIFDWRFENKLHEDLWKWASLRRCFFNFQMSLEKPFFSFFAKAGFLRSAFLHGILCFGILPQIHCMIFNRPIVFKIWVLIYLKVVFIWWNMTYRKYSQKEPKGVSLVNNSLAIFC